MATPERLQQVELQSGNPTRDNRGICVSLVLQNFALVTVGGWAELTTQKECLSHIGCYGKGNERRLAEIITGFALGVALSRLAANVRGHISCTRGKLGRSLPAYGLQDGHLNDEFFARVLGSQRKLVEWNKWDVSDVNEYIAVLDISAIFTCTRMCMRFGV